MRPRRVAVVTAMVALVPAEGPHAQSPEQWEIVPGTTPIADVNQNDGNGFAVLESQQVTIEGVVQLGSGVLDPFDRATPSTWFYVSDGTGGVAVAHGGQFTGANAGDRVQVTSRVGTQGFAPIRGTRTLDFGLGVSNVTVVGSGAIDAPVVVSAEEIVTNGAAWEGTRVRIAGLTIVDPGEWPSTGGSAFVRLTDGVTEIRMYVDDDTDIPGSSPPASAFDVIGFVAQDDTFPPFLDNHYVYPTSVADLIAGDGSGLVQVVPSTVPRAQTDVMLTFTLTGQEATLEALEINVPPAWSWTPALPVLSGPGFSGAVPAYRPDGAGWVLSVSGAAVTATDTGALAVSGLVAPNQLGGYRFTARTATAGGTLTEIVSSPSVTVVVTPGDVVLNELYCVTRPDAGIEHSEFIELRNLTAADLDVGGWTLTDVGRTSSCTRDARWAFPAGTILPAGDFLVVCRTARDPGNPSNPNDDSGFLVDFPDFPPSPSVQLFELYDASIAPPNTRVDPDDPTTPNLVLLDPTREVDDQISLLGGPLTTNGGQCESATGRLLPFAELVTLRSATGEVIDALTYQNPGPCEFDFCAGTVAGEPYRAGPPKFAHTLGRDAASTDRANSWEDLLPSSEPTPGAVNVPGDTVPPALVVGPDAGLSASVIQIRYDEPVYDPIATQAERYTVIDAVSGDSLEVLEVHGDPDEPGRRYYVFTGGAEASAVGRIQVREIPDIALGAGGAIIQGPNAATGEAVFSVPSDALTICRIQEFDEIGFSPFVGETVLIVGFVTVGEIPLGGPYPDRLSIWVQELGGCGVNVFSFDLPGEVLTYGLQLEDLVQIRGVVTEFVSTSSGAGAVTEVADPTLHILARGLPGPEPIEVSTHDANDERLEGTLIHTTGVVINSNALAAFIDDNSGSIQVFQNFSSLDLTRFTVGDKLDVTGIITQFDSSPPYFSGYELVPQNQEAIFKVDGEFAAGAPTVDVQKRVLVPDLGETIRITATSPFRSQMIVEIYDMLGRKVTTLYDGVGLGPQTFDWNGVNQWGSVVDAGAYVCHVRAVALDGGPVRTASAPIIVGLRLNGGRP